MKDLFFTYLTKGGLSEASAKSYESYLNGIDKNLPEMQFWHNVEQKQNDPAKLLIFLKSVLQKLSEKNSAKEIGRAKATIENWRVALNDLIIFTCELIVVNDNDDIVLFNKIIKIIEQTGGTTSKMLTSNKQQTIFDKLKSELTTAEWFLEYLPKTDRKDRIDIFGIVPGSKTKFIIELDASRADQVAKKFVSRIAIFSEEENLYHIAVCYPGTKSMSKPECEKYFDYCGVIAQELSRETRKRNFTGIFIK